jgi:hypothetical protein
MQREGNASSRVVARSCKASYMARAADLPIGADEAGVPGSAGSPQGARPTQGFSFVPADSGRWDGAGG